MAEETRVPAAVVFDNDGLLLDTEPCWTITQEELFAAHGREFSLAAKHEIAARPRPPWRRSSGGCSGSRSAAWR